MGAGMVEDTINEKSQDRPARPAEAGPDSCAPADDMATIRVLPMALVNKIAAGEVIERPASVVKELLENAIDAGATQITCAIEGGGRGLIRVTDNGGGIPPEQVPLAFAQHATSKIQTVDDLFAIGTMGFRGEALASIAAVSHTTMISRHRDRPDAFRFAAADAANSAGQPCAAPVGTTVEVRDLFYSVPARRKFLRSDATEFGHIHEIALRIALPHPNVAIGLSHNGRNVLSLAATPDHRWRVAEALGKELYSALIPINLTANGVTVSGFAGLPELARPTARLQYLFLNQRFVRDRSILHAVKEAYRGLIEPASQPAAVIFLFMDPMAFDVNVHPQKTEVRFRESNGPFRTVLAAVREQLLQADLTPAVKVNPDDPGALPPEAGVQEHRQRVADFFQQGPPPQPRLAFGVENGRRGSAGGGGSYVGRPYTQGAGPSAGGGASHGSVPFADPLETLRAAAAALPKDSLDPAGVSGVSGGAALARPFVQVHHSYVVAETADGLVIIDQHALHERIIYEDLYARATRGTLEAQRLLMPEIINLTPPQQAVLDAVRPLLAELGIEITPMDSNSIAIHSFPSLLAKVSPAEFLRDLFDRLHEVKENLAREELLHEVLDMASCKAAVKAGYPLGRDEIQSLLDRKQEIDRSSNCPHGRPTTLRLTLHDLEKQFKRK